MYIRFSRIVSDIFHCDRTLFHINFVYAYAYQIKERKKKGVRPRARAREMGRKTRFLFFVPTQMKNFEVLDYKGRKHGCFFVMLLCFSKKRI